MGRRRRRGHGRLRLQAGGRLTACQQGWGRAATPTRRASKRVRPLARTTLQDGLNRLQATARQLQQAAAAGAPARRAAAEQLLSEAARQLAVTVADMWQRARVARLRSVARGLSLQQLHFALRYAGGGPLIPPPPLPAAQPGQQQQQEGSAAAKRAYLFFAFPPAQLPSYLRAPLAGPAAGPTPGKGGAAGAAASLSFVLALQFPPVDARRFWLLVSARDPSGLPGPVFARLPVPAAAVALVEQQQQQQSESAAGLKGADGLGKRKRSEDAPAAAEQQQQDQDQDQQQQGKQQQLLQQDVNYVPGAPPLPPPGWPQDAAVARELTAAVAWAQQRMIHERLLFELSALGVACQELQPQVGSSGGNRRVAGAAAPPPSALRLRLAGGIGANPLCARFARRTCARAGAPAVGVDEVVLCARGGSEGEWSAHVRGPLYCSFGCASGGAHPPAFGGGWARHDFSFGAGGHARDALARVLGALRAQRLLCQLEWLARGGQRLEVERPAASSDGSDAGAADAGKENAAAEQNGEARPSKKPCVAAGAGAPDTVCAASAAEGLSWHWPGSGAVRLVGVSDASFVIECGAPLPGPPSAAGGGAGKPLGLAFSWEGAEADAAPGPSSREGAAAAPPLRLRCRVRVAGGGPAGGAPAASAAALEPALQALGEMADAGEAALLLDALGICGWPLAALAEALAPATLRAAGLPPRGVSAHGRGSPYQLRLLLAGGGAAAPGDGGEDAAKAKAGARSVAPAAAAAAAAVDLRFATGGRVCLSLRGQATAAAGSGKPSPPKQAQAQAQLPAAARAELSLISPPPAAADTVLPRLAERLPGVALVADPSGARGAAWVHASCLARALPAALVLARERAGNGAEA
jgi:hypothetical protein